MRLLRKFSKRHYFRQITAYVLTCCMFFNTSLSVALAGPEGAQVVNGQVTLQQSGYNTTITASDRSIINYSSFDIARPEIVQFVQPHSSASVLNRILSANPTNINGTLLANGRVFFVNPAGVYIGAGATINVNQLVASGLNISNSDFINGQYNFVGGQGSVVNWGDISAEKVYLIGKQVANSGSISCPSGYVVMASGDRVFIGEPGRDVVVEIDAPSLSEPGDPADSGPGVLNEGTVDVSGGKIVLAAAGDIYSQAISNVGSLSTSVETGDAGQIKLTAADGQITNAGTIEASGDAGGSITIDGGQVTLTDDSVIHADATGTGAGGEVLIYADNLDLDGIVTAAGIDGYVLFDPVDVLDIDQDAADAIEGSLIDTETVDVGANVTINLNGEINSSLQTNDHTLNFKDDNANNDLTINLNNKIILGANQTLTGDGTEINVASTGLIQNGIDVAASGATIEVIDAGTYNENLTVNKSDITLKSKVGEDVTLTAGSGIVVDLDGGADGFLLGGADGEGFTINSLAGTTFLVQLKNAPQDVEISWNSFDTTNDSDNQGISVGAAGATGLNINNNTFTTDDVPGVGGVVWGDGSIWGPYVVDVSVTDNTFTGPAVKATSGYAVEFAGVTGTGTSVIQDNIISNYGMGIAIFNGTGTSDLIISGNEISNSTNGIRLGQYSPGVNGDMTTVTVTENILSNNTIGLRINNGANVLASNFTIQNNSFSSNTTGLANEHTTEDVTATQNYWGALDGPSGIGSGSGDPITAPGGRDVDYSPWLGLGTDAEPGIRGFQPVSPMTWGMLGIDGGSPQDWIDDYAGSGDTLNLTYSGDIILGGIDDSALADPGVNLNINTSDSQLTVGGKVDVRGTVAFGAQGNGDTDLIVNGGIDPLSIHLFSDDDVTINDTLEADDWILVEAGLDGSGSVSVDHTGFNTGSLQTTAAGSDITITAGTPGGTSGDILLNGAVPVTTGGATGDGHLVTLNAHHGVITMDDGSIINAGDGKIDLDADGDITLGRLVTTNATNAAVTITSTSGGIIDNGDTGGADIDAASGRLVIDAVTGVGNGGDIETTVASIDIDNTTSGNIDIDETDALDIFKILQDKDDSIRVIAGGAVEVLAAGTGVIIDDTSDNDGDADITIQAEAGSITVSDVVRNDSGHADADITLNADGDASDVAVNAAVTAAAGDVTVQADNGVTFGVAGSITATGAGNVVVTADADADDTGAGRVITMANGTEIDADTGTIALAADEDIAIGRLVTMNDTASAVSIISTNGAVTDAGSSGGADIEATAANAKVTISAVTGIGSANPIETIATMISADTTDGDIDIDNAHSDPVTVTSLTTGDGDILFSQAGGGSLDVALATTADGSIGIDVTGAGLTAHTVTAADSADDEAHDVVLTTTTSGNVIVDNITADNQITIVSAGSIEENPDPADDLTADILNLDAETGIGASDALETSATAISADTTNGNIDLDNTNASAVTASSLTTGTGNILFSQDGDGALDVTSATTADGSIGIDVDNANLTAGTITAGGAGDIVLTTTTSGNVLVDNLTAVDDQITINSDGAITESGMGDVAADLTADTLSLTANDDIGFGNSIETAAVAITARTIDPTALWADIVISNDNAAPTSLTASTVGTDSWIVFNQTGGGELTLTDVSTDDGLIDISANSGNIVATLVTAGTGGNILLDTTTSGDITLGSLTATGDKITIDSAGSIDDAAIDAVADLTADELDLDAADGIGAAAEIETVATTIDADTTGNSAHIDIDNASGSATELTSVSTTGTGANITFDQTGGGALTLTSVTTTDGTIDVSADSGNIITTLVTAGTGGNILLDTTTSGDITLGSLTATGDKITIDSAGSIDDAAVDAVADLTADELDLDAADGIGAGAEIETVATSISADTTDGDIDIDNTHSDPVTVTSLTTGDGDMLFSQAGGGSLDVALATTADGGIGIDVTGAGLTAHTVTAADAADDEAHDVVLTTTTSGNVIVDNITADNQITIVSAGSIEENPDAGIDLEAIDLELHAVTGIGATDAIETDVASLEAHSTTGDIVIAEKDDVALKNILAHAGNIFLEATDGEMTYDSGTIKAGASTLTLIQKEDLDLAPFTFDNQGNTNLTLQSYDGSITADNTKVANAADKWNSITATAKNNIELFGDGNISIASAGLSSTLGGVRVVSVWGTISTPDAGGKLNAPITGYSDASAGIGVDTPGYLAPSEKAAIIIWAMSQELMLGPDAILTANGAYDPLTFDDRSSVGFLLDGDPIDIAIYLSSFPMPGTDIEMGSGSVSIDNTAGIGTLVIDARDTVTFTSAFENSLAVARPDNVKRLEVVSRVSEDLQMAQGVDQGGVFRLPHADDPSKIANGFFDGTYVLRGRQLLSLIARILSLSNPVPLALPRPFILEPGGEVEEPDMEGLLMWLCQELGLYESTEEGDEEARCLEIARAYLEGRYMPPTRATAEFIYLQGTQPGTTATNVGPNFRAIESLRQIASTLEDPDETRITALTQVVSEFMTTPVPPSEEVMNLIAAALAEPEAGTHYATAGEWLDAVTEYVGLWNTTMGRSLEESMARLSINYFPSTGVDPKVIMFLQKHFGLSG